MKYRFTTTRLYRNEIVNFLVECGVDRKPGDKKKRIRAAIDYAKTKNRIEAKVNNDGEYYYDAKFFQWAVWKWPELEKIENLPLPKMIAKSKIVHAQEGNLALGVHAAVISRDYGELREQFSECLEKLKAIESENKILSGKIKEQNEELVELRAYKENRIEQNRANARKSRGVKKGLF